MPRLSAASPSTRARTPDNSAKSALSGSSDTTCTQRDVDLSPVARNQKCQLEPNPVSLVARPTVFVRLRGVAPALGFEQPSDSVLVVEPDGDVDVIVDTSDRPGVEVDCPPAEQPVIDTAARKEFVRPGEGRELLPGRWQCVANTTCHVQNRRRR